MQHSPQEIRTRLGEAVDPEGNVLNMAAVVEVIGLLERTPLTKEALEQTRIGRTVNLLRKKTDNEDIARRAKKLVKRWQKLVQNHLEAVRNTNSPLNGLRCNSPVVNGLVTDEDKQTKQSDRKNQGLKRKRSSADTPPPRVGEKLDDSKVTEHELDDCNEKKADIRLLQDRSLNLDQSALNLKGAEGNLIRPNVSVDCAESEGTSACKRAKSTDITATGSSCADERKQEMADSQNTCTSCHPAVLCHDGTKSLDHHDVRWDGKDFSQQTDDIIGSQNSAEDRQDSSVVPLDVEEQANGINGRFGEDGQWYDWSQTMTSNSGSLIILPYVSIE